MFVVLVVVASCLAQQLWGLDDVSGRYSADMGGERVGEWMVRASDL